MQYRHIRKSNRRLMPRVLLAIVLVALISVGSVVTVMANTVDVLVRDGEETYSFSMFGTNAEDVVSRAEEEGMAALSEIDRYEFSQETGVLTVTRGVRVSVTADGAESASVVDKGTSVEAALESMGITLGVRDIVTPAAQELLEADTEIVVVRSNRVFVLADGKRSMVDVEDGTVADALKAANVTLEGDDTVTPTADTALTNGMHIQVARFVEVSITADGETQALSLSAATVGEALESAKIELGENDRIRTADENGESVAVSAEDVIVDGMVLTVQRITFEEVTETESIDYDTSYEYSSDMYEDESETKTAGVEGERRVTYRETYVDGEYSSREEIASETISEPTDAVVVVGTTERPTTVTGGSMSAPSGAGNSGGATFTDASGETVSYSYSLTGSCTAYTAPAGATTSIGATAQPGYVAVDPKLIPYGSLLYITSPYGTWDYGYCYAMDTGGAAMAGDIVADLFYNTYDECAQFGRRDMTVYVIRSGY